MGNGGRELSRTGSVTRAAETEPTTARSHARQVGSIALVVAIVASKVVAADAILHDGTAMISVVFGLGAVAALLRGRPLGAAVGGAVIAGVVSSPASVPVGIAIGIGAFVVLMTLCFAIAAVMDANDGS